MNELDITMQVTRLVRRYAPGVELSLYRGFIGDYVWHVDYAPLDQHAIVRFSDLELCAAGPSRILDLIVEPVVNIACAVRRPQWMVFGVAGRWMLFNRPYRPKATPRWWKFGRRRA